MRQKIVGVFEFGYEYCQLVIREGYGGEFWLMPGHGQIPRIKIGVDSKKWVDILKTFQHEVIEFAATRLGLRYLPNNDLAKDTDKYIFIMNHAQLGELCAMVADFELNALPALKKAWKEWHKKPKKQGKDKKKK